MLSSSWRHKKKTQDLCSRRLHALSSSRRAMPCRAEFVGALSMCVMWRDYEVDHYQFFVSFRNRQRTTSVCFGDKTPNNYCNCASSSQCKTGCCFRVVYCIMIESQVIDCCGSRLGYFIHQLYNFCGIVYIIKLMNKISQNTHSEWRDRPGCVLLGGERRLATTAGREGNIA